MLKWINKKRNKKGFTLVELVVVIAILGILAGIAVPKLSKSRENAAIAAHNANVRTLESAATLAVSEGSSNNIWGGDETGVTGKDDDSTDSKKKGWINYLQDWPGVPSGVLGLTADIETTKDDGNKEVKNEKIPNPSYYKVEIKDNGVIKVTPGKIIVP